MQNLMKIFWLIIVSFSLGACSGEKGSKSSIRVNVSQGEQMPNEVVHHPQEPQEASVPKSPEQSSDSTSDASTVDSTIAAIEGFNSNKISKENLEFGLSKLDEKELVKFEDDLLKLTQETGTSVLERKMSGIMKLLAQLATGTVSTQAFLASSAKLVESTCTSPAPEEVNEGIQFTDCDGFAQIGTFKPQTTTSTAVEEESTPAQCTESGQQNCLVGGDYQAVLSSEIQPEFIKTGSTIASISGTFDGATLPATCTSNGEVGCITDSSFRAADLSLALPQNIKDGITIAGVTGNLTASEPIVLDGFSVTPTGINEADISIDFPSDTSDFGHLEIRHLNATSAGSCSEGSLIKSYANTFADEVFSVALPGGANSFAICLGKPMQDLENVTIIGSTLTDSGLFARYFMNEADTGKIPSELIDSSTSPVNLAIEYDNDFLIYTSESTGRGLDFSQPVAGRVRSAAFSGGKLETNLDGVNTLTAELVVDVSTCPKNESRLLWIGNSAGGDGGFAIACDGVNLHLCVQDDSCPVAGNFSSVLGQGRRVIHVVFDSTEPNADDRLKFYVDGNLTISAGAPVSLNHALSLPTGSQLQIGNRGISGSDRSFYGSIYYLALYSNALSSSDITQNYKRLRWNDDP